MRSLSIKSIAGGLVLTAFLLSSASAADMVEGYYQPHHVRVVHHHVVRTAFVRNERRDCGQLVYEYRTVPPYTEIKTMCGPRPVVYDTGVVVQ